MTSLLHSPQLGILSSRWLSPSPEVPILVFLVEPWARYSCARMQNQHQQPHDDLVFVLAHLRPSASIAESHTHTEYRVTPPLTLSGEDLVESLQRMMRISYVSWAP